jgi:hypothetical protein
VGAPADVRRSPARTGPTKGVGAACRPRASATTATSTAEAPPRLGGQSQAYQPGFDQERPADVSVAAPPAVDGDAFGQAFGQLGQLLLLLGESGLHRPPARARRSARVTPS